ncbi:OB-fold nucleic acid binding domain-containing protein [Natronosporangium hydrolyticum]|uniref:OB-fold nucleic acid binding domain-containing protein n=1 Tax=Natronosporangium hydrolyticum TaxID=2811111 RepID=A0A895YAU1_9ACTN|nr:OB-fold nucleic acid binding domain-containing protein [Natronosporangium hydrolyticum]QSB13362.1 OB-fold nucleic acid binding domain-containing protein [Natronosporangium hydrolyticum]
MAGQVRTGSRWRRLLGRWAASDEQRDAEQLRSDSVRSGCAFAGEVNRGDLVVVTGRLRTVVYTPRTNLPTLEAELYDGSGTVTLVWLGRRRIVGVEPGRTVTVRGRVAQRAGRCVIYNPYYELVPGC